MKIRSRRFLERICYNFFLLSIAIYSPGNYAQQEEVAGRVVATSGQVTAVETSGSSRLLSRRSQIFVGDVIVTEAAGFAQIRMSDSAIISLKENTQFEILAYQYEENPQSDVSTMRLIEGGFRTITGSIGEQNQDAYSVETEYATIGIRGTDHEGVIDLGALYTGVYDGGTDVSNNGGSVQLGIGADYDFAFADDPNSPPQGLIDQPSQLGDIAVISSDEGDDEGDDGDDGGDDGG